MFCTRTRIRMISTCSSCTRKYCFACISAAVSSQAAPLNDPTHTHTATQDKSPMSQRSTVRPESGLSYWHDPCPEQLYLHDFGARTHTLLTHTSDWSQSDSFTHDREVSMAPVPVPVPVPMLLFWLRFSEREQGSLLEPYSPRNRSDVQVPQVLATSTQGFLQQ